MIFKSLTVASWRQFAQVNIDLHPNLTILTGANGSGKTTLLNLLAWHYGWDVNFIATPYLDRGKAELSYRADTFNREVLKPTTVWLAMAQFQKLNEAAPTYPIKELDDTDITLGEKLTQFYRDKAKHERQMNDLGAKAQADYEAMKEEHKLISENRRAVRILGNVVYEDSTIAILLVPENVSQQYHVEVEGQTPILGLHIPSHRPVYGYQLAETPTELTLNFKKAFESYYQANLAHYKGEPSAAMPNKFLKEALFALEDKGASLSPEVKDALLSLEDNESLLSPEGKAALLALEGKANYALRTLLNGFQNVLLQILPAKIGFEKFVVQPPEILMQTKSGTFSLDAVSGGIASIIDIAWQIFLYTSMEKDDRFVCTIDEPENHLHPELQQTLLPNLINAFDNVQFIVATHSPFMITAVEDSFVYVLDYNEDHRVESQKLNTVDKAGTANQILRDVLGLPYTVPLWAGEKLKNIVSKYEDLPATDETVENLEAELSAAGLSGVTSEHLD